MYSEWLSIATLGIPAAMYIRTYSTSTLSSTSFRTASEFPVKYCVNNACTVEAPETFQYDIILGTVGVYQFDAKI